jgi:hypothetical protein
VKACAFVEPAGSCLVAGAVPEQPGGDGADREDGHDQHDVPQDRGRKPTWHWSRPKRPLVSSSSARLSAYGFDNRKYA